MKLRKVLIASLVAATLGIVGCSKQGASVDTAPLENSFQSADTSTKSQSDTVVSEIKSANYSGAVADLTKLAKNAKLTPDQQQAIQNVLTQVQKAVADAANKVASDASKAAGNLQNSLPNK